MFFKVKLIFVNVELVENSYRVIKGKIDQDFKVKQKKH